MHHRGFVKRPNPMSVKLLLSYLSILAVPLLAIAVVYSTAVSLMYTVQQERLQADLQATAQDMRRNLQEAANLGSYLSTMPEVSQLEKNVRQGGGKATFFQMYQFSMLFPDYTLLNSAIQDVYFFFRGQDYVIRLPAVMPADNRSYEALGTVTADDYDSMLRFLDDTYWDTQTTALNTHSDGNRQLGVLQSFPYGAYDGPLGTLLILLDNHMLDTRLRTNLIDGEGLVVVRDATGRTVKQFAGEHNTLDPDALDYALLDGSVENTLRLAGQQYAVCRVHDDSTGYTFYNLVPKKVLVNRVGYIKPIIALLCALSVLVGLTACVLLWSRRRRVVLRYSRYTDEFGNVDAKGGNLWDGLHAVLDSVAQLQTTAQLQSSLVRSGVIQRLLKGEYTCRATVEKDLSTAAIRLEGQLFCAAAITFNRGFSTFSAESINEFRLRILDRIDGTFELPHYCCEPEDLHIALVIPTADKQGQAAIIEHLRALEDDLVSQEHVEAYIGLGACTDDIMHLSGSYRQARSVCEYLRFYNIRSVMSHAELPTSHETFHFPLEMELRLIRAIEQGNHADLQEVFGQLAVENFASRQLTYETHKRLLELVRSTALRALRGRNAPPPLCTIRKAL